MRWPVSVPERLSVAGIDVYPRERRVLVGEHEVELTAREFDIMMRLASHPGWVFSAERLADSAEAAAEFSRESVSVHVSHLRHKLAAAGAGDVVRTVRGIGYRLEAPIAFAATEDDLAEAAVAGDGAGEGATDGAAADAAVGRQAGAVSQHPRSGEAARLLRDSFWRLEEAVLQIEHDGTDEQLEVARTALDAVRRAVYGLLAE